MLIFAAACSPLAAQQTLLIRAAKVITGTGEEIDRGEIIVVDGRIELVGRQLDTPRGARVIDASDRVVMPGLIHAHTRHGLPGYSRGGVNSGISVKDEIYLDQIDFEPMLEAGYTAACYYPGGGGIPGRAAVYRTAGSADSRLIEGDGFLRVLMTNPSRDKPALRKALERAQAEIKKVDDARKKFEEEQKKAAEKKENEKKEFEPPKIPESYQPIVDLLEEKPGARMLIEVRRASDLVHLDDLLGRFKVGKKKNVLAHNIYLTGMGSADYSRVVDRLGERSALVLASPAIDTLPDTFFWHNTIAALTEAGARVALVPASDSSSRLREERERVAELIRAGLSRESAVKGMTAYVAQLLGIDTDVGTIEKGKAADLIFLDSDPFDPGSRVVRVMILGETVWEMPDAN